jgi:hypothetical protein
MGLLKEVAVHDMVDEDHPLVGWFIDVPHC